MKQFTGKGKFGRNNKLDKKNIFLIVLLAVLSLSIFLASEYLRTSGRFGAPLDDVYIHYRFAQNLAEGKGFSYNAYEQTPGDTSPAWVVILASLYKVSNNFIINSKIISALFFILTIITVYIFANDLIKNKIASFFAALTTAFAGRFVWAGLSGMEIALFSFLTLASCIIHFRNKKSFWTPIILGIASTVRPEGYALFAFYVADYCIDISYSNRKISKTLSKFPFLQIIIYLAIISPYLIFSYVTTGSPLPNTFQGQGAGFAVSKETISYAINYLFFLLIDFALLAFFIPFGIFYVASKNLSAKKSNLVLLWTVGFIFVSALVAPNLRHFGRYMMPLIPFYAILAVAGVFFVCEKFWKQVEGINFFFRKKLLAEISLFAFLMIIFLALMIPQYLYWADKFGWNVRNINDQQVQTGFWVKNNIPENSIVALNDIGAITFISDIKIIDMVGLVSPDVLEATRGLADRSRERDEALWKYLGEMKPDYVIIFPEWYPHISANNTRLEKVHSVAIAHNTVTGGNEMVVYKAKWD